MNEPLTIDKTRTALVVIDLQKGIVSMPTEPRSAADVVSNAARLAEACRAGGMPVFLVHVTPSADQKDRLAPPADAVPRWNSAPPADWSEIVPELRRSPSDFVITKRQWGAFTGTELDLQLRRRRIDTIILCGISTNIGVESTARFAYELGYAQVFVEDAMAAMSAEEHEHAFRTVFARIGRARKTDEVLGALA